MNLLTANLVGKARRVIVEGREWMVAPMTLLVSGVLNGSKGALYYPPDEIANTAPSWDQIPITVYHPTQNGIPVSAGDPGILDVQGVGYLKDPVLTSYDPSGRNPQPTKLRATGWFNVEAMQRIDPRVLMRLEQGNPLELSTGLFTDNERVPIGTLDPRGKPYDYIARHYRPDHLAILPDQVGACSINDGCGVLVNHTVINNQSQSIQMDNRTVVQRFWDWMVGNAGVNQPRHPASGQYLPHGAGTGTGPAHEAAQQGHGTGQPGKAGEERGGFTNPATDDPNQKTPQEEMEERLGITTKGGKTHNRKSQSQCENEDDDEDDPECAEYNAKGSSLRGSKSPASLFGSADVQGKVTSQTESLSKDKMGNPVGNRGRSVEMKYVDNSNPEGYNQYTGKGGVTAQAHLASAKALASGKEEDHNAAYASHTKAARMLTQKAVKAAKGGDTAKAEEHMKNAGMHRQLSDLHDKHAGPLDLTPSKDKTHDDTPLDLTPDKPSTAAEHHDAGKQAWAAMKGAKDKGEKEQHAAKAKFHFTEAKKATTNEIMAMNRSQLVNAIVVNGCACHDDVGYLTSLPMGTLRMLARNAKTAGSNSDDLGNPRKSVQAGGEEDEDGDDRNDEEWGDDVTVGKGNKSFTGNRSRMDQWIASMPEEARGMWDDMRQASDRERHQLIGTLASNSSGDPEQVSRWLAEKPTKELRRMLTLLGNRQDMLPGGIGLSAPMSPYQQSPSLYGGVDLSVNATVQGGDDLLDIPTINWAEWAKSGG